MLDKTVQIYHFSKLLKLDATQHKQCLFCFLYLLPLSISNLSQASCIGAPVVYRNFPIKDWNYNTTWDFKLCCWVVLGFSDLPERYVSIVLPNTVRDFKPCYSTLLAFWSHWFAPTHDPYLPSEQRKQVIWTFIFFAHGGSLT